MTKHNNPPQKYKGFTTNEQLVLPMNIGIEISANDKVRLLSKLLEEMDYTETLQAWSRGGRPLKYPNRILFRIWVYALMENIRSTRDVEKACRRNIHFPWLLEGHMPPSHNTLNRFRQRISDECINQLFSQRLQLLAERKSFGLAMSS
jgi:transposase